MSEFPADLYDGDGYPTEAALDSIGTFEGTAQDMSDYVRSLMRNGFSKLEDFVDDFGRPRKRLTLVTGGWSGCESVISELHKTMFHFMFWESSFRGGKYTYDFSITQLAISCKWGKP